VCVFCRDPFASRPSTRNSGCVCVCVCVCVFICLLRVPSCMSITDSQLKDLCVCLFFKSPQMQAAYRLVTSVCVCVCFSSVPGCMSTIDSQLGVVCLLRTSSCKLTIDSQLGARVCVFCHGPCCKPPIDSQLSVCVCVEGPQLHEAHRLATRG